MDLRTSQSRSSPDGEGRPRIGFALQGAGLAMSLVLLAACEAPRPPAAASNEVFPASRNRAAGSVIDDRWAGIVLDDRQQDEVRAVLLEATRGETDIRPLRAAPDGVRFEDVPRAMLNAAPKVEMAILRATHLHPELSLSFRDRGGRAAVLSVTFRPRGPIATVDYRVPGTDVAAEKASIRAAVERRLATWRLDDSGDPEQWADRLARVLSEQGAMVSDRATLPERHRYVLLMLDEEEAVIEIRRVPPPEVVAWTATAGTFSRPDVAERLGATFLECLRDWGRVPRWTASTDDEGS